MMNQHNIETIAALATPPGRGGVAIVRISGPLVTNIMQTVLHKQLQARLATHAKFYSSTNEIIDEGLAIYFPNPNSFTGEDVLELHLHGSPVVIDLLLEELLQKNIRLARPGEFCERAFLNNKIDLTQAEAIADLIDATSRRAARLALRSLQGEFAERINAINQKIITLRVYVEAAIDFVDEEIDFLTHEKISSQITEILHNLEFIQKQAAQGSKLREGIKAVIMGEPNVGKSSLLNCLSEQDVAIVTNIPGTTRDVLRNQIILDGLVIQIVDTAGLRVTQDLVEQEGVKRAYDEIETADFILYMRDASATDLLNHDDDKTIHIINKIDLSGDTPGIKLMNGRESVYISVKQDLGIDELKNYLKKRFGISDNDEGVYLARRRHLHALNAASSLLAPYKDQQIQQHNFELVAVDLNSAHQALSAITGEYTADDLLGQIFANFCVGK